MTRTNFILYFVVLFMALGKVNAEHQYRKLFSENEHQKDIGRQLNLEYSQLQLEQSTLSMHSKIEDTAKKSLRMKEPETKKIIMYIDYLLAFIWLVLDIYIALLNYILLIQVLLHAREKVENNELFPWVKKRFWQSGIIFKI